MDAFLNNGPIPVPYAILTYRAQWAHNSWRRMYYSLFQLAKNLWECRIIKNALKARHVIFYYKFLFEAILWQWLSIAQLLAAPTASFAGAVYSVSLYYFA